MRCFHQINYAGGIGCGGIPFFISSLDIHGLIHALTVEGAVSVPLLTQAARQALLQEAESFHYEPEVKTIGTGDRIVRTEYTACNQIPKAGQYSEFKQAFQTLMDEACDRLDDYPFSTPLQFNELVLQRYEPGQLGITPHRDSLRAINLIALVNLSGQAEFYRCDDRQGSNAVPLDTTPGNVIFLRAPGFLNTSVRPFHYLTNIRSTRYSLGLRQRIGDG
jgi:hypothetical protein